MKKNLTFAIAVLALGMTSVLAYSGVKQSKGSVNSYDQNQERQAAHSYAKSDRSQNKPNRKGPPPEAFEACVEMAEGGPV